MIDGMTWKRTTVTGLIGTLGIVSVSFVSAWTLPTADPPGDNVPAPVNVGTTDQVKNAGLGVNSLAVFGNAILSGAGRYFNFGATSGSSGYGIRDNAGLLEFKNSGGSWESLQTTVFDLVGGSGSWTASGNDISNSNTGNVGIKTVTPGTNLTIKQSNNSQYSAGIELIRSDTANHAAILKGGDNKLYLFSGNSYMTLDESGSFSTTGNVVAGSATLAINGDLYMPWKGQWLSTALNNKIDFDTWGPGSTYFGTNGDIYLVWRGQWLSTVLSQVGGNPPVQFGPEFLNNYYYGECPPNSMVSNVYNWGGGTFSVYCRTIYYL